MDIINTLLINPIINILVACYQVFLYFHIPFALGFAIVAMTVIIRFLLAPFTAQQLTMSKKMQELAPGLAKIKEKYKGDMKRQQEATMALYKEQGVNPAAGCLPGIVQIVILVFGLYPALQKILTLNPKEVVSTINDIAYFPFLHISKPWDTNFLGMSLEKTPDQLFSIIGPIILLVPLLTGIFQFIQSKMMYPTQANQVKKTTKSPQEDFAATFQKQALYLLPIMIAFFSWTFSVGLSLYWNTYTIFGIIQQYRMQGLGGLEDLITQVKGNKLWKK